MLAVVGAPPQYIDAQVHAGGPFFEIIKAFAKAPRLPGQPERILL